MSNPNQPTTSIFITKDSLELNVLQSLFEEAGIPIHARPQGVSNALASGSLSKERFDILVTAQYIKAAQDLLLEYLKSEVVRDDLEPTFSLEKKQPDEEHDELEDEYKRRFRYAWVFLIPILGPLGPLLSLVNSNACSGINQELDRPDSGGLILTKILATGEIAIVFFIFWQFLSSL